MAVNEAYSILRDVKKKEEYDISLDSPGGFADPGNPDMRGTSYSSNTQGSSDEDFKFHEAWNPQTQ